MKEYFKIYVPFLLSIFLTSCSGASPSPSPTPETTCEITWSYNFVHRNSIVSQVIKGEKIKEVPTISDANYTFEGWYQDPSCLLPIDLDAPINQDVTYYAYWSNTNLDEMISLYSSFASIPTDFSYNRVYIKGNYRNYHFDSYYPCEKRVDQNFNDVRAQIFYGDYYDHDCLILYSSDKLKEKIKFYVSEITEDTYYEFFYAIGKNNLPLLKADIHFVNLAQENSTITFGFNELGYIVSYFAFIEDSQEMYEEYKLSDFGNSSKICKVNIDGGFLKNQIHIEPIEVKYGETIKLPDLPSEGYYDFNGYFYDEECQYSFSDNHLICSDITLYCQWSIDPDTNLADYKNLFKTYNGIDEQKYNFVSFNGYTPFYSSPDEKSIDCFISYDSNGTAYAKLLKNDFTYTEILIGYNSSSFNQFIDENISETYPSLFLIGSKTIGENVYPIFNLILCYEDDEGYEADNVYTFNPFGYLLIAYDFYEGYSNYNFLLDNYQKISEPLSINIDYNDINIPNKIVNIDYGTTGKNISFPSEPIKENYVLENYFSDRECENNIKNDVMILKDSNVYALWGFDNKEFFVDKYSSFYPDISSDTYKEVNFSYFLITEDHKGEVQGEGKKEINYLDTQATIIDPLNRINRQIIAFKSVDGITSYFDSLTKNYKLSFSYSLSEKGTNYLNIIATSLDSSNNAKIIMKFNEFGYLKFFERVFKEDNKTKTYTINLNYDMDDFK